MRKYLNLLLVIFLFSVLTLVCWCYNGYILRERKIEIDKYDGITSQLDNMNLDSVSNLMIVAHPDDEMIWGGAHLIEDNYLVVCITCGVDDNRVLEFKSVMKEVNDDYLMLAYPDLTNGKRDDWEDEYELIFSDIKKIIDYKNWKEIITHNPNGEYGHIHHKKTSNIVTEITNGNALYYFGKYYSSSDLDLSKKKIDEELLDKKENILKLYVSQDYVVDVYRHMLPYENFVAYVDWS